MPLPFSFKVVCTRLLYRMRACRGNCMNLFMFYFTRLVKSSEHTGHPDESLARANVYSQPVTGSILPVKSVVVSCWSYTHVQYCFQWSGVFVSPVQYSSVQYSSVQSSPIQRLITLPFNPHLNCLCVYTCPALFCCLSAELMAT